MGGYHRLFPRTTTGCASKKTGITLMPPTSRLFFYYKRASPNRSPTSRAFTIPVAAAHSTQSPPHLLAHNFARAQICAARKFFFATKPNNATNKQLFQFQTTINKLNVIPTRAATVMQHKSALSRSSVTLKSADRFCIQASQSHRNTANTNPLQLRLECERTPVCVAGL